MGVESSEISSYLICGEPVVGVCA